MIVLRNVFAVGSLVILLREIGTDGNLVVHVGIGHLLRRLEEE